MPDFTRYAIYYCPDDISFMNAGADWLGRDMATGTNRTAVAEKHYILRPQKYGFHATLKAPFRLANGTSKEMLRTALVTLAGTTSPFELSGVKLSQIGRFFALTPMGDSLELNNLAALCVTQLDQFRAPLTQAELAKRRRSNLNPTQDDNLVNWGYPHVLDQFRFHMTLTGPLGISDQPQAKQHINQHFAAFMNRPLSIKSLCLVGEDASGYFHLLSRIPLG